MLISNRERHRLQLFLHLLLAFLLSLVSLLFAHLSLVTRKMHGPRLSGAKWERHKTVTFHENCEVVEFSRDEDESGKVFESDEDDYGNTAEDDVDFFGEGKNEESPHDSYEDIELSDQEPEEQLELDADTSITGRSTHFECLQSARIEEEHVNQDVKMLPDSPSPMKPSNKTHLDGASMDGLVPKFELPGCKQTVQFDLLSGLKRLSNGV
ncbi:hypothetical protein EV368DRAFT_70076 [Lentinula lateritia]|nr:hypothetical protein EV368DRAFT_70076 [Lentinula lateritia]